jgi:hypothetical protein
MTYAEWFNQGTLVAGGIQAPAELVIALVTRVWQAM